MSAADLDSDSENLRFHLDVVRLVRCSDTDVLSELLIKLGCRHLLRVEVERLILTIGPSEGSA